MEIRRSYDRLISTMGFPILVRRHLYIELGPCTPDTLYGFMWGNMKDKIYHLVQDCSNSNANTLDVLQSSTKPVKLSVVTWFSLTLYCIKHGIRNGTVKSDFEFTKWSSYLNHIEELWGFHCWHFRVNLNCAMMPTDWLLEAKLNIHDWEMYEW